MKPEMKFDLKGFLIFFLVINLISQGIIWSIPNEDKVNQVKCFDEFRNEIIGLECKQEINGVSMEQKLLFSFFVLISSIIVNPGFWSIVRRRED